MQLAFLAPPSERFGPRAAPAATAEGMPALAGAARGHLIAELFIRPEEADAHHEARVGHWRSRRRHG